MARPKGSFKEPSYRLHKASGQACVTIGGRTIYLGTFGSTDSRERYAREIAEWYQRGRQAPLRHQTVTVSEVIAAYWPACEKYYGPGSELEKSRKAYQWLRKLYGETLAKDFGPLSLKALRSVLVQTKLEKPAGTNKTMSLSYVNNLIGCVLRCFRWAGENEIVPATVPTALYTVRKLQRGRNEARETDRILPADEQSIDAVIAIASPTIAAMIRLQLLTGARPGEVCAMRACDIDMSKAVWWYKPPKHKTQHHGIDRLIPIGPKGQAILREFLSTNVQEYFFRPADSWQWSRLKARNPHSLSRRKWRPLKTNSKFNKCYNNMTYRTAVQLKSDEADRIAHEGQSEVPAEQRIVERWHPHQLRHNAATRIRAEFGLEAARLILGHQSASMTETYAEPDLHRMEEVMSAVG